MMMLSSLRSRLVHRAATCRAPHLVIDSSQCGPDHLVSLVDQIRFINLFEVFSKEKMEERRQQLKEEMQRGYFDDFKDLRQNGGKTFVANNQLIPAKEAVHIPSIKVEDFGGNEEAFPPPRGTLKAALLCVAFRGGAETMLASWSEPFRRTFASRPGTTLYEVSLVESKVMSWQPFRRMIRMGPQGRLAEDPVPADIMPPSYIFYFGDCTAWRKALGMTNRLTGYVFLMDEEGRMRWRGSGKGEEEEVESLIRCTRGLLSGR
eukprot:jgi/Botrbrau1/15869/Bobra.40_1s0053.1